jgi:hypothetical protein
MPPHEEIDLEEQKFLSHDSSDPVSVEIRNSEKKISFNGLSKEEVMKFGKDPQWVKIRMALFVLFWIVWFGMLAAAILIVAFSPKCPAREKLNWAQKEVFYQVDVEYFQDSNGDFIGDLNGLKNSLDYLKKVGFKTLVLKSNLLDENNLNKLNPNYGTLEDLKALRKELNDRGMFCRIKKIYFIFVFNIYLNFVLIKKDMHVVLDVQISSLKASNVSFIA